MNSRLKNLYYKLEKHSLDGLLVSSPANITYLTGYPSRDSLLLVSKKENFYFTDSRYVREASLALKGIATLKEIDGSIFKLIAGACKQCGLKVVGFEERNVSVAEFKKLHEGLTKSIKLIPTYGLIEGLRQLKQPQEVKKISQAIQITAQAF